MLFSQLSALLCLLPLLSSATPRTWLPHGRRADHSASGSERPGAPPHCQKLIFGAPNLEDCQRAISFLPNGQDQDPAAAGLIDFIPMPRDELIRRYGVSLGPYSVETPQRYEFGNCHVVITNLQGASHAFADTSGWTEMNNVFHDISDDCLSNGIGGMKITGDEESLAMYIYESRSYFEKNMELYVTNNCAPQVDSWTEEPNFMRGMMESMGFTGDPAAAKAALCPRLPDSARDLSPDRACSSRSECMPGYECEQTLIQRGVALLLWGAYEVGIGWCDVVGSS